MRVMVLIKSDEQWEAGGHPSEKYVAETLRYHDELRKAGVLLASEGLHPSSKGKRVRFSGGKTTVIDGPFTETKELIGGFSLWQVKSMDEAIEWVKRFPSPGPGDPGYGADREIEIRPVFEMADVSGEFTPELREQLGRYSSQVTAKR